jgi:peptidoglycan/xylan/chitin deacetylase (PgdA/CDA1 family)
MEKFRDAFPAPRGMSLLRKLARDTVLTVGAKVTRADPAAPTLRAIYCHYVFDDQVDQFERMLLELRNMGRFVDTRTLLKILSGEEIVEERLFHLSFDDGYRNIVKNALPVLRSLNIPAIFFVPTSFVTDGGNAASCGATLREGVEMVSWSELEMAVESGLDVGSHTRTHARFTEISTSPAAIEDEICGSKEDIARRLGFCDYISWPYGRLSDSDELSLAAVKQAGYEACFGAYRGRVSPGNTDRYSIPRHHVEVDWPRDHLRFFARGAMETA